MLLALPVADSVVGGKGYGSKNVRAAIAETGATPIIPRRKGSKLDNDGMDWCLYKYRHLVENAFARLKHFRGIATRYDKLKRNYASAVALACCVIWLPM